MTDRFDIIYTADESPSLIEKIKNAEPMHNSQGAFGESLYIYGQCINLSFKNLQQICCASIGLGLGYNEIIFSAYEINHKATAQLYSFESSTDLSSSFLNWIFSQEAEFDFLYQKILTQASKHFDITEDKIKNNLKQKYNNGSWTLSSFWPNKIITQNIFNCILLDLYSPKTDIHSWEESQLEKSLRQNLSQKALLTTYSSNGKLNRVLKKLNFKKINKKGFHQKRECTLAVRGFDLKEASGSKVSDEVFNTTESAQ